ncbi:tyrosine- phosphatase non-receptor type substrate 1-like [Pelobates cultripes]|uniref:Tyrosine- phosphatase non-receptor type substrate 1-like n=1 Tax=Pelobates cultripes TaxID=61616 RepID=A0AAD1SR04_PELCU|nr:tyrosine- phosphatase non-receptor type substrate 1-like [Pelobates cultripes]
MAYTRFLLLVLLHQTGGVLEVNVPSSHQARMGSETLIPCMFTVDKPRVNPKFLVVSWYFQKKQILKLEDEVTLSDGRFYINTSRAINGDVSLYISIVTIFDIGAYTCSVLYSPDMMEKQVRLVVHGNISII